MENFLIKRFAKRFGKAEEAAFVNSSCDEMPTGILQNTDGADVGVTVDAITTEEAMHGCQKL